MPILLLYQLSLTSIANIFFGPVVNVASLVPDQHHCNLRLRVLSVEIIAETVHPESKTLFFGVLLIDLFLSACRERDSDQFQLLIFLYSSPAGKILQSAEAIVGDDTACILLILKNGKKYLIFYPRVIH